MQLNVIVLLHVEGKIFISVVASSLFSYLKANSLIDISVQKAGIPGYSLCLEPSSIIWHQIQAAKIEGRDLHVVFLDLANTFGSVSRSVVEGLQLLSGP